MLLCLRFQEAKRDLQIGPGGTSGERSEGGRRRDLLDKLDLEHALGAHEEEEESAKEEGSENHARLHTVPEGMCHSRQAQHCASECWQSAE